jgi:hypothetical protein
MDKRLLILAVLLVALLFVGYTQAQAGRLPFSCEPIERTYFEDIDTLVIILICDQERGGELKLWRITTGGLDEDLGWYEINYWYKYVGHTVYLPALAH